MRIFIAHAIARTYQKIDLVALGSSIDSVSAGGTSSVDCLAYSRCSLQGDAAAFAASQGWTVEGGDAILPLTADNTQRPKQAVGQDGVKYAELASLIQTLSR